MGNAEVCNRNEPRRLLTRVGAVLFLSAGQVLFPVSGEAGSCDRGTAFDLERATTYVEQCSWDGIAPRLGRIVTTKDDQGTYYSVLSWDGSDLDSRVFGYHAASLYDAEHRRRLWSEVSLLLATLPSLRRAEARSESLQLAVASRGTSVLEETSDWVELGDLLGSSAETIRQMNLGYLPRAEFGAGLANRVKKFVSDRQGGSSAARRLATLQKRYPALSATLRAVPLITTLADQVVAASLLEALATDEAVIRGETIVQLARVSQDPTLLRGALEARDALRAVQDSDWYEYVRTLSDHLPELVSASVVAGAGGLHDVLVGSRWWRSVGAKGGAPQLLALAAAVESTSVLVDQNLTLQRAALFGVIEGIVRGELERRRRQLIRDDQEVLALQTYELLQRGARVSYFENLLAASGTQGGLDPLGGLIRLLDPGQRELRATLEAERERALLQLQAAVAAHRSLLCGRPSACIGVAQAIARGERFGALFPGGSEQEIGAVPYDPLDGSVEVERVDWLEGLAPNARLLRVERIAYFGASGSDRSTLLLRCTSGRLPSVVWSGTELSIVDSRLVDSSWHWTSGDAHCCPSLLTQRVVTYSDSEFLEGEPVPTRHFVDAVSGDPSLYPRALEGNWEFKGRSELWYLRLYRDGAYALQVSPVDACPSGWAVGEWRMDRPGPDGSATLVLFDVKRLSAGEPGERWAVELHGGQTSLIRVSGGSDAPDGMVRLKRVGAPPALQSLSGANPHLRFLAVEEMLGVAGDQESSREVLQGPVPGDLEQRLQIAEQRAKHGAVLGQVERRASSYLICTLAAQTQLRVGETVILVRNEMITGRALVSAVRGESAELELLEETTIDGPQPGDRLLRDEE